jgi:RNA polymerase sigma-70 factor (sigma-E family)
MDDDGTGQPAVPTDQVIATPLVRSRVADRAAQTFEEFVLGQSTTLLRVGFLLTGDRHVAEDLLQGVLERMYVRWSRIASDPTAYARRAMVNAANSRWRSRARRPETTLSPEHDSGEPDRAESVATQDAVLRALRELTPKQRAVVVLRYLEDLTEAETASSLRMSLGTVKSHSSRGLARMRAAIAAQDASSTDASSTPEGRTR